jgi:hypothetical protein
MYLYQKDERALSGNLQSWKIVLVSHYLPSAFLSLSLSLSLCLRLFCIYFTLIVHLRCNLHFSGFPLSLSLFFFFFNGQEICETSRIQIHVLHSLERVYCSNTQTGRKDLRANISAILPHLGSKYTAKPSHFSGCVRHQCCS